MSNNIIICADSCDEMVGGLQHVAAARERMANNWRRAPARGRLPQASEQTFVPADPAKAGADRGDEWLHQQPGAEQRGRARTGAPHSLGGYGRL